MAKKADKCIVTVKFNNVEDMDLFDDLVNDTIDLSCTNERMNTKVRGSARKSQITFTKTGDCSNWKNKLCNVLGRCTSYKCPWGNHDRHIRYYANFNDNSEYEIRYDRDLGSKIIEIVKRRVNNG